MRLSEKFVFCPFCGNGRAQGHEINCKLVALEDAAERLKRIILQVYESLPAKRDWLDPVLEAQMKEVAGREKCDNSLA